MSIPTMLDPMGKGRTFRILDRITISCPRDGVYKNFINDAYTDGLWFQPFVSNGYSALIDLQNIGGDHNGSNQSNHCLAGLGGGVGYTDWYRRGSAYVLLQGGYSMQQFYCTGSGAVTGPMDWAWHEGKDTVDIKMQIIPVKGSVNQVTLRTDYKWPLYSWNEDFVNGTPWIRTSSWTIGTAPIPVKVTQVPGIHYDFVKLYANVPGQFEVTIYPAQMDQNLGVAVYIDGKFDKFIPINSASYGSKN